MTWLPRWRRFRGEGGLEAAHGKKRRDPSPYWSGTRPSGIPHADAQVDSLNLRRA